VNDRDILCPNLEANARFRFRIDDDTREPGTVLAASTLRGGEEGPTIRIHGDRQRKPTPTDVATPYSGITFQGAAAPCLMLKIVPSAQSIPASSASASSTSAPLVPRGSKAQYRISLEPVP
jgi:hypothetical protein